MIKTVLITGANKGIGFEVARQLAEFGFFVYLGSRNKERGDESIQKLNSLGLSNVENLVIDVTDGDSIRLARTALESKITKLDVLINNAGIGGELPQDFSTCDLENVRRIFDTNFFGAIQTSQEFLPLLKKSGQSSIINISSEVGSLSAMSAPDGNASRHKFHAYGASKTALNAFTVMLANELLESGVSVNSVTPGHTATDLNGFQGTRTAAEGAAPIVKLATEFSTGITAKFYKGDGEANW